MRIMNPARDLRRKRGVFPDQGVTDQASKRKNQKVLKPRLKTLLAIAAPGHLKALKHELPDTVAGHDKYAPTLMEL